MAYAENLAYQLRQAGLDPEYWADSLKAQLNITLPQQIEHLDGSNLEALTVFARDDWEKRALRKLLKISDEPILNHTVNDGKSELVFKLTEVGLNVEYWIGVLKTKLGITRIEQTKHLQADDLRKLNAEIRYGWEEKALLKLFGICEKDYEAFLSKLQGEYKQQLEEAEKLIRDVAELKQKASHCSDDNIKRKVNQITKLVNVTNEQWVKNYDDKSLDDVISKLTTDLQNLSKVAENRPINNASEILETSSGGLALRGILVGKDFCDDWVKNIVLSPPTDIKLMNPVMQQVEDIMHFSSKAQSDHFHRTLDTIGHNVATTLKAGGWGFHTEPGFCKNHEEEDDVQTGYHSHTNFESRLTYSFVPIAACQLNYYNLRFSEEVLRELKVIDRLLLESTSPQIVEETCEMFLRSYGSHINAGILHFGGVSKFIATYTSEIKSDSGKTMLMVTDALNAYVSASVSGLRFRAGASISADNMNISRSFVAKYGLSEQAKVCLYTLRNGGPQEVSALPLWKKGLVTHNSTWALIDRGNKLFRDFIGIWKLIFNHKGEFLKPFELSNHLKTMWEKMSGYRESGYDEQSLFKPFDIMDQLVDRIGIWNSHPITPEKCVEYLQEVLKTVELLWAQTETNKHWEYRLCTEVNISSFLENVVELEGKFSPKDKSMLQFLIRKLVAPCAREFPVKGKILEWAEVNSKTMDIPSILGSGSIKSIPDLIGNMKERFVPALTIKHAKNIPANVQVSDRINAGATVDLAFCVCKLLEHLQSAGRLHEVFFLRVALLPLHYDWLKMKFETIVEMEKLQSFVTEIENLWKGFEDHSKTGIVRLEAFLIHILLTYVQFHDKNKTLERKFTDIVKDLRKRMSHEVNMVLKRYATDSPFDWFEMTHVTSELAKGNMSSVVERKVEINELKQILEPQRTSAQEKDPKNACKLEVMVNSSLSDILKTLRLEEYYPSKISLADVILITKTNTHPTVADLPWIIIRKILMLDFHARDHVLLAVKQSESDGKADGKDGHGVDDFLLESKDSSDCEDEAIYLNTLDVLVTIFTCCDSLLKQTLARNLFVCKLAIPFLYPLGSEHSIGMSLWALRTITVQCYNKLKGATETVVTDSPFPVVTFIRLGRPPLSKSRLMNDILTDESHNTFFNRDCDNGTVARRMTDGLVECSWFISAGREEEQLPCTMMFLNLRGDASSLKKQMEILNEVSSVLFVIGTAVEMACEPYTSTCREILRSGATVILFLICGNEIKSMEERSVERKICVEAVGKNNLENVRIISSSTRDGKHKNASKLKKEARGQLSEAIVECRGTKKIEEIAGLAKERGIIVDEFYDKACSNGKALAKQLVHHMKGKDIADCKKNLLPMQGKEWLEYSNWLKIQHRPKTMGPTSSSAYRTDQVKQKMVRLRERQVDICCEGLSPFIKDFMSGLQSENQDVVLYFLKWITILLDEKSRFELPQLRREYQFLWRQLQQAKTLQEKTKMKQLKATVNHAELQLASASTGLQNVFREVGQIYEAVRESKNIGKDTREVVEKLPEIASKLLIKGHPLELVDGDASAVPISWVSAVLGKLENILGKKRLFVLSVLGIQSSGKSTLLNTMFGLQFPVSAGRCTRGAYIQLIPVSSDTKLPFDYVVVIDTEGLRAPELGLLKHEHDNELSTLVVGMGDATVFNIKGENTAEIKDILQIVVHAFLRMSLVSNSIKNHRICMFVHQNVQAANAGELMIHGSQKLQEDLDEMVKEAAYSENISDVHSFAQLIDFDVQKHVWNFSDLWLGDPPMAPANPGYSKNVATVKLNLLCEIAKQQTTFLTTSDLILRLTDLWNGILADDFVFSFRNSLEVKAYNALQSTYYTLEWELQNELRNWLQTAEIKTKMSETRCDLENTFSCLESEGRKILLEKAKEVKKRLLNYFGNSNLKGIIIQWQQSKLSQLDAAVKQQQDENKADLLSIKEAHRVEILQKEKWYNYEMHIMNKAVELADKLKSNEVTRVQLEEKFNDLWRTMVNELATKNKDEVLDMNLVMEFILYRSLPAHANILKDELERQPLFLPFEKTYLEGSITLNDLKSHHVSLKTKNWHWDSLTKLPLLGRSTKTLELHAKQTTILLTETIMQEISTYLKRFLSRDVKFQKAHASDVIKIIIDKINTYNQDAQKSGECKFTILPTYLAKLAVHVSRYCITFFSLMQDEYNRKNGVKAKLENCKKTAWSLFQNMVIQSTEEVMAGDLLCTEVKGIIEKAVGRTSMRNCVDEVLRDFQMTKYYLIVKIMDDLACNGNFEEYEEYINSSESFALRWITKYTDDKMFTKQDENSMSRFAEIASSHIRRIISHVAKSVQYATQAVEKQEHKKMALWIEKFCKSVSEKIAVPVSTLKHVSDRQVLDFENLQRIILNQLDKSVQADLEKTFANATGFSPSWDGNTPPCQILEKIWGCHEQCPICEEPCADTTSGHHLKTGKSHMCVQHRPDGIAGVRWARDTTIGNIKVRKGQLSYQTCNFSVTQKNMLFSCRYLNYECRKSGNCTTKETEPIHSFQEYRAYLPYWDIAPDPTNNVSKYWMWFMVTYQNQLKDLYEAQLPNLPETWNSVTKDDALSDLRKIHN